MGKIYAVGVGPGSPKYVTEIVKEIIQNYFNSFFVRHVSPMCQQQVYRDINIVGSLAIHFYSLINNSATLHGLRITSCIDKPIHNLLKYHLSIK